MNSNVHISGKLGFYKKRSNEQAFRHPKSYCVKFCLSPALRSDQSAEKVQCHSGSASSWSSTTCPVGVHCRRRYIESRLLAVRNDLWSECQNHRFGSCQVYLSKVFIFVLWSSVGQCYNSTIQPIWSSGERSSSESINLRSESVPGEAACLHLNMSSCSSILSM